MNVIAGRQTSRWLEFVYGGTPALDDPAETYHEASKLTPSEVNRQLEGALRLAASPDLQLSSTRAVKRHGGAAMLLPSAAPLDRPLGEAIERRRSQRAFGHEPISRRR